MTVTAPSLRTGGDRPLELGELLGRGGEARVYALKGDSRRAVKVYLRSDRERAAKLDAMLSNIPDDRDRSRGHVSIAWPEELALDPSGEVVGFVMPRIDAAGFLPLHQLYHPRSRRSRAPGISWRYLVRIARNLSATLAALHEAGYVVGDLNESNILANDRALVTLVDLDSIQVTSGARVFRCPVGKAEYTPPELQGSSFRETTRRPSSDRFGLAVLTFLLLMEGNHPFAGVYRGEGEPPGMEENIRGRRSGYFGAKGMQPPPAAPSLVMLDPKLRGLLKRALLGPAWRRPGARELQQALAELEENLSPCPRRATHLYREGLSECPWCRRAQSMGYDAYPATPPAVAATTHRPSPATAAPRATASPTKPAASHPTRGHAAGTANSSSTGSTARQTGPVATRTAARQAAPANSKAAAPIAKPPGPGSSAPTGSAAPRRRGSLSRSSTGRSNGFRGSWLQFHGRLPILSLLLLALLAAPALLFAERLLPVLAGMGAGQAAQLAVLSALSLLPPLLVGLIVYHKARHGIGTARALFVLERVIRAAAGAALLALLLDGLVAMALGRDAAPPGDWLLLPALWVIAFVLLLRAVGPRLP